MSPLDMRTIVLSYMVTNIVCVWFVVLLWRQNRNRFEGMAFWVVDFVFQAAALFLIVMRGAIPDWISMVLSNTLVIVGAILGFVGLERFMGKRGPQIQNYLLVILFIFVQSYFAFVQPNLTARVLNIAVALLLVCFQSVWLMWRRVEPGLRFLTFGVGAVNFLYCLLSSVRIAHFFIAPHVDRNYFQPALFEALVLMSYQVLFILLTYSFVLMVNKRLLMEVGTQEEKFSKAFQSAPYAITLARPVDGKIIELNESFSTITGYDRAEVLERNTTDLNLWENEEDRAAVVDALSRTGSVRGMELRFRKKSGEALTGIFSAEIIAVSGEKCILSSISDITDRKRAEVAQRERKEFAENLIASMQDGFSVLDSHGVQIDVNPAFCQMTGFSREELIGVGTPHRYWPPKAYEEIEKAFQKTLRGDFGDVELTFMRKNGERFPVIVSPSWVKDKQGNVTSYFATVKDITERKQMEEEKRRLEERSRKVVEDIFRFIPEGVLVFSRKMELLRQNQAFREMVSGHAKRLGFTEDELENLIVDKIKAAMGDENIKEIRVSRKHENGEQT